MKDRTTYPEPDPEPHPVSYVCMTFAFCTSSPAERFEQLRENINARRLRPDDRVELSSNEWENSDDLHRGDEIARRIPNSPFWHHGIYLGDGLVSVVVTGR